MSAGRLTTIMLALALAVAAARKGLSAPARSPEPAPRPAENDMQVLQFLFEQRLSLFNIRRDHEWRVIFGAMVVIGAVDAGLLTQQYHLDTVGLVIWCLLLIVLFATVFVYQWGVQTRNRVDRLAMDEAYRRLCDAIDASKDGHLRIGIDRSNEKLLGPRADFITHFTYLWAFWCQMIVLGVGCLLSAALPLVINGGFRTQACTLISV
jgi:hypothetical protein